MSRELSGGPQASLVSSVGVSADMLNLTVPPKVVDRIIERLVQVELGRLRRPAI